MPGAPQLRCTPLSGNIVAPTAGAGGKEASGGSGGEAVAEQGLVEELRKLSRLRCSKGPRPLLAAR